MMLLKHKLITDYIKEVLYILNESKMRIILLLLSFIIVAVIEVIGVGSVALYVSVMSGEYNQSTINNILQFINPEISLTYLGIFLICVFLTKSILSYILNYYLASYGYKKQTELRSKLLYYYSVMPYNLFINIKSTTMVNVIMNYATNFTSNIAPQLMRMIADIICLICLLVYLIKMSPVAIACMVLFFIILMSLYDLFIKKSITRSGKISNEKNEDIMSEVKHTIDANREMRVLGLVKYFVNRMYDHQKVIEKHQLRVEALQLIPKYMFEISMVISIVIISLFLIYSTGQNSVGILSAFVVAGLRIMPAALNISRTINIIRASRHVLSNLYEVVSDQKFSATLSHTNTNISKEIFDRNSKNIVSTATTIQNCEIESIEIKNVYYQYNKLTEFVLNDVSMRIAKGDCVGISGPSGSGKSTLIGIILGLIKPTNGISIITANGKTSDLHEQQNMFAYIPQETFIINDTISTNVAIGVKSELVDLSKLKSALKMAQIDFLKDDEELCTRTVGENGAFLSGGQRQRLALARVFYHNRDIIILDEVTSALDKTSEHKIINTINELKSKKTFIIVTHSKEMLKICNKVYEIDNGNLTMIL